MQTSFERGIMPRADAGDLIQLTLCVTEERLMWVGFSSVVTTN
jgi:hypothetical protein